MKIYIPSSMFKLALEELKAYNMSGKWFTNAYFQLHPVEIVEIKPLLTESEKARKDTSFKRKARKLCKFVNDFNSEYQKANKGNE